MQGHEISFAMFTLWSLGIICVNIYLSAVLNSINIKMDTFVIHLFADIGVSALAGLITYILAETLHFPNIYLVMVAAIIGHLSARVAYKSGLIDLARLKKG